LLSVVAIVDVAALVVDAAAAYVAMSLKTKRNWRKS